MQVKSINHKKLNKLLNQLIQINKRVKKDTHFQRIKESQEFVVTSKANFKMTLKMTLIKQIKHNYHKRIVKNML